MTTAVLIIVCLGVLGIFAYGIFKKPVETIASQERKARKEAEKALKAGTAADSKENR